MTFSRKPVVYVLKARFENTSWKHILKARFESTSWKHVLKACFERKTLVPLGFLKILGVPFFLWEHPDSWKHVWKHVWKHPDLTFKHPDLKARLKACLKARLKAPRFDFQTPRFLKARLKARLKAPRFSSNNTPIWKHVLKARLKARFESTLILKAHPDSACFERKTLVPLGFLNLENQGFCSKINDFEWF